MRERVEELMQLLNMNPTQFANAIGVQRATLQHILSGRNEPSLKIVMAIHTSFPDVELEWLLNGKGSAIPRLEQNKPENDDYPLLPGLESMIISDNVQNSPENSILKGESNRSKQRKSRNNKDVKPLSDDKFSYKDKRIKEVVVFFADGTYQKISSILEK